MVYPFARHVSERGHGHPDGFPVQLELKSERFGMAFRSLLACAFVRPESEQNSSHPPASTAAKAERWIDCPVPRQSAPKRSRRPKARTSSWPASATTTIYARWHRGKDDAGSPACPRALSWSFTPLPWPNRVKTPVRSCSAELTMLSPFASTHSKVAEQQVIRTFVTAPIHFGCHRVDAFPDLAAASALS